MQLKKCLFTAACLFLVSFSLISCVRSSNPLDPYESYNRKVFAFNQAFDAIIAMPVAKTYITIVPPFLQQGVSNFYDNFWGPTTIVNDILQGKIGYALSDTWRFLINSTIGLLGFVDVASHLPALPRHYQDLGLTFAYWGAKQSAYTQIPFFGPFTYRDAFARPIDTFAFSLWPYIQPKGTAYALYAGYLIDARARALPADKLIKSSFDPYIFVRNAYLQYRDKLIAQNKETYLERRRREANQKNGVQESVTMDTEFETFEIDDQNSIDTPPDLRKSNEEKS